MEMDVILEDARWQALDLDAVAARALAAVAARVGLDAAEAALLAADDARIAALNRDFRGKPTPTNVLSWPASVVEPPALPAPDAPGAPVFLGDLALAYETCAVEAEAGGVPLADHVTHLIIHGLLHLLGYDHVEDDAGDLMEALEIDILATLDIASPY